MFDSLIAAIDAILLFAQENQNEPLNPDQQTKLCQLDADFGGACQSAGLALQFTLLDTKNVQSFGNSKIPYYRARSGFLTAGPWYIRIFPSTNWMQAMRGLRAAAVARQGQRAGDASDQATKPKKKLGRKPASEDAKQKDQKIYEAWQSGRYKDYSDLAMQFDLKRKDVERAIDRHEKRIKPKE